MRLGSARDEVPLAERSAQSGRRGGYPTQVRTQTQDKKIKAKAGFTSLKNTALVQQIYGNKFKQKPLISGKKTK